MDILEITNRLNDLAFQSITLKDFQSIRAEIRGLERPRTYKLFSASTVFNRDDIYAFHDGGRSEIQFNIGVEYLNDEEIFRYGLGFSLEPNQSQPDPVNFLTPKIKAFNKFVHSDSPLLNALSLWHYKVPGKMGRSDNFQISPIPPEWIIWGNFIFLGKYFSKSIDDIDENDLIEIIKLFEKLLPVFEYVETNYGKYQLEISGERISRICWNDNGWVKPSGRYGKSEDVNTHEGNYGYGHEEWLGDISKIIDGYHYAFLESIRKTPDAFANKLYNVDLFSINGINKNRYLIGKIKNLEVLDDETSAYVKAQYIEKGWLNEMGEQIIAVGANNKGFSNWEGVDLFNIRFKPEDLLFFSDYILLDDEKINDIHRYSFAHKTEEINLSVPINKPFIFIPDGEKEADSAEPEIETSKYERVAKPIEITYLHKMIRDALKIHLVGKYGNNVRRENPTGQGTLIDIARQEGDRMIFYEIKSYYNLKACIREAIGQLLEYAYWPNSENADEIIIVSQNKVTSDCKTYLDKLRKKYSLPIYYQHFDLSNNELSEKY